MSNNGDTASTMAIATAIPANATISGIVIAANDPRTTSSTTIATGTPTTSAADGLGRCAILIASPPTLTSRPWLAAALAVWTTTIDIRPFQIIGPFVERKSGEADRAVAT